MRLIGRSVNRFDPYFSLAARLIGSTPIFRACPRCRLIVESRINLNAIVVSMTVPVQGVAHRPACQFAGPTILNCSIPLAVSLCAANAVLSIR
ncbi:MAG: hypothetical protein AAGA84_06440, partial [Pseudomonadota bacterium]